LVSTSKNGKNRLQRLRGTENT